jgi:hypothetical protein
MALGATDRSCPDGRLRCRHPGRQKEEEDRGHEKPQSAAPIVAAAAGGWSKRNKRPRPQGGNSGSCPVHPNARHSASECREIIKLAKRVSEQREQSSKDGSPPHRRPGKERINDGEVAAGERELGYQSPEGDLKDVFTEDSDFGDDNDRRKKLYVMYGGSWELTSRRNVKSLRHEVLSATPGVPKAAPHQRWRSTTISFGASDCPNNMAGAGVLPLITAPVIANMRLHHVLIDDGAGLNVISHAAFKQLQIPGSCLGPSRPFSGVGPQPVYPLGSIALPVTFETEENFRTENIVFDVVEVNLPFNAIISRPTLYRFMAIAHYRYLVLKMPSPTGVLIVRGDRAAALMAIEKPHALVAETTRPDDRGRNPSTSGTKALPKVPKVQPSGADDVPVKAIRLTADSTQTIRIAGDLDENQELVLVAFLQANADMFAWEPSQMPGIPREVIEHHLKINPDARPVSQKPRRQSVERQYFIRKEVRKLLDAGLIEEVHHPVWLANPVIVPKANGKLRMCIDYTSLNKACPKDPYPLPCIDQIVDSTSGCDLLSFLDAYSSFHQIQMSREDRKHTTFVTVDGLYYYVVMPYGLKNALPTFVQAMSKTFGDLIRDKVEVYVDDIMVKTKRGSTLVEDLTLVFDKLRATRTKLNPHKCVFGVTAGKLLGFLVSYRGIEANPEKIKAIEAMRPPTCIKDVQKLTGSLAALSRFISRLAERALPFFKLLWKSGPFSWIEEAEQAF